MLPHGVEGVKARLQLKSWLISSRGEVRAPLGHGAFTHRSERAAACQGAAACSLASFEGGLGLPGLFFTTPADTKAVSI